MSFRSEFGAALERQLQRRGLTQTALSKSLGCTTAYTSFVMTGHRPVSAHLIDKMAKAISLNQEEQTELHIAAARQRGYKIPKKW